MSDRLPYEEQLVQQMNDLPFPDENMAWTDMKRRLEEDDDDGVIPIWLRGCGLWGLIAIVMLGIGWWIVRPEKWWNKQQGTENITTADPKENTGTNTTTKINTGDTTAKTGDTPGKKSNGESKHVLIDSAVNSSFNGIKNKSGKVLQQTTKNIPAESDSPGSKKKIKKTGQQTSSRQIAKQSIIKKPTRPIENDKDGISISRDKDSDNTTGKKSNPVNAKDSAFAGTVPLNITDSVSKKTLPDPAIKKDTASTKTNETRKDSSKTKKISFSAGAGMHQLMPVDGQKLTPYNSVGRQGSLLDYIPSVFARMYKDEKWFIQLEFRYGAPQSVKELVYRQQTVLDTLGPINNHMVITSTSLKKTFYHQLPLTFNYFVLPNWSVGTGVVWNKFVSAVSQQKVNRKEITTQVDSILSNNIIKDKGDTVFKKSYFQAIFETQYRWKRFSIGAKYSFGLEPYIRFTLPGSPQTQERNKSLQLFLRYELWKPKPKK